MAKKILLVALKNEAIEEFIVDAVISLSCYMLSFNVFFLHLQQKGSDIMQRSILGHILPEAMVHFLENHSAEKFAETFLGEFDTPEAIWSAEMRSEIIHLYNIWDAAHLWCNPGKHVRWRKRTFWEMLEIVRKLVYNSIELLNII